MASSRLARTLIAGLALLTASGCKPLDDVMVVIFGRSMRDSRSFDPYENPRPAPEGSVSFSSGNYPSAPGVVNLGQPEGVDVPSFTLVDMNPVGTGNATIQRLVNPFAAGDADALARGDVLYQRFCVVCHGPDGIGANAYIADKHPLLPAYNLAMEQVQGYSDQYLYGMIRVGRGFMPEYGSRTTHFDRWAIVMYVRELQRRYDEANADAGGGA